MTITGSLFGATIIAAVGLFYVWDTYRGHIHPRRITWALWAVSAAIGVAAQLTLGVAWNTVLFTAAICALPAAVVIASLFAPPGPPDPGLWWQRRVDLACAVVSLAALAAWVASGATALALSIAADAVAGVPTLVQAWRLPRQDSVLLFTGGTIAALDILADPATGSTYAELAWPVYFLALNVTVLAVLLGRRWDMRDMHHSRVRWRGPRAYGLPRTGPSTSSPLPHIPWGRPLHLTARRAWFYDC